MASKSLGSLTLDLIARTGGFVKGMSKAERESKRWRRQVERDLRKLGGQFAQFTKIAAGAGVAAAGAFTILAKEGLQFVDSQAKMARQVGGTIDGLRGLQIAANDAGIDTNVLNGAVDRLNVRLGEARRGSGQAYEALQRLGLSADALANMDADERIAVIADRVQELGLDSADTADLLRNLGIRNREMVNLLMAGGEGIRQARQEVDEYGLSLSEIDASRVEKANDQIGRIPRLLEPIRNQIAINLAEPLIDVADLFNDAAKASNGFAAEVTEGMAIAVETIGTMIDGVDDLRLSLMKIQRFQLGVSAFAEQARLNAGQGMGRMQGYGADNPPPETGPATAEYNRLDAEIRALEEGGNALQSTAEFMREQADNIRQGPARRAALQAGFDAGLGDTITNEAINAATAVADSMRRVSEAADDSADADEDKAGKSKTAAKAVDGLGASSAAASRALSAIGGGDWGKGAYSAERSEPSTVRERIDARADPSAYWFEPNPTARPTWSTDYLPDSSTLASRAEESARWSDVNLSGLKKVQSSTESLSNTAGARDRGTVTIQVVGDNGNTEGQVEGDDAFIRQLTNALSGAAASK